MSHISALKKKVEKIGGTVEGGLVGRWYRYNLNPPEGSFWNATGETGSLAVTWRQGDLQYRVDSIIDAIERVDLGVSPIVEDQS